MNLEHVLRLVLVAVLPGAALVAVTTAPAQAVGVACQRAFASDPTRVFPIPDGSFAFSLVDVPEDGLVVSDVDVSVDVRHLNTAELTLDLLSHTDDRILRAGTRLFDHVPGGADLLGTVFDDEARAPTTWGVAPFIGRFIPAAPLRAQDGASGGQYTLIAGDAAGNGSGTLVRWSLVLTYRTCDLDRDGVEDHVDQCRGNPARTATGCPVTSRAVSAAYRHGRFRGVLSSPVAGCEVGRQVLVLKVRRGADARVGTAITRADGSWRLAKAKKRGRYYATSVRVAVPDRAECPAVRSRTVRIH
jgi:hypothetical protein